MPNKHDDEPSKLAKSDQLEKYGFFSKPKAERRVTTDTDLERAMQLSDNARIQQEALAKRREEEAVELQYDLTVDVPDHEKLMDQLTFILQGMQGESLEEYTDKVAASYNYPTDTAEILVGKIISQEMDFTEDEISVIQSAHIAARSKPMAFDQINKSLHSVIEDESVDIVVISIGSGGSKIQQTPPLAEGLSIQAAVTVINIDPGYKFFEEIKREKPNTNQNNVLKHLYVSSVFPINGNESQLAEGDQSEHIERTIQTMLDSGKKIIFIQNTSPIIPKLSLSLARNNPELVGHQLAYIGAYHDFQPAMNYSAKFLSTPIELLKDKIFDKDSHGQLMQFWASAKSAEKTEDREEFERVRQAVVEHGQLFENLSKVDAESVFPHAIKTQPKPL